MTMEQETLKKKQCDYLTNWLNDAFFETRRSARGHIKEFSLHDLMRELSIEKAKENGFFEMISSTSTNPDVGGSSQPRRIAILCRVLVSFVKNDHLRTLVRPGTFWGPRDGVMNLKSIHNKFKLLRVLHICDVTISALPKHIGDLRHLRYLGIINTKVRQLPKSIINLENLMYLWYASDDKVEVPDDLVCNMKILRGLTLPSNLKPGFFRKYRLGLSSKKLQTLYSGAGTWMTTDLHALSPTVQCIKLDEIQKMEEIEAIYRCPAILEDCLSTLACSLMWTEEEVEHLGFDLEKIKECRRLWKLDLEFPLANNCLGTLLFPPNIAELSLTGSKIEQRDEDLMQILGELSKLKVLSLTWNAYLGKELSCSRTAFPQLNELSLSNLENLEEWRMEEGAMARLSKLEIFFCQNLKRLPASLRFITTLKELCIFDMPEEFCSRIGDEGEDASIIEHISCLVVTSTTEN